MDTQGELHHSGNEAGKIRRFGRVGGLGQAWLELPPVPWAKSEAATTAGTFSLEMSQWLDFFFPCPSKSVDGGMVK